MLIRPPDILVGGLMFYCHSSSFLSSFRHVPSELAERNSTIFSHTVGSKCNLKTHVQNLGYPLTLQIAGTKTALLRRLDNLTTTSTAYIPWTKRDIHNWANALTTAWGLLHRIETTWTLVHKILQIGPPFYPPCVNSALYFIARLRRRRSANETQPNFVKRWMVNRANNLP